MDLIQPPGSRLEWYDRNPSPLYEAGLLAASNVYASVLGGAYECPANKLVVVDNVMFGYFIGALLGSGSVLSRLVFTPSGGAPSNSEFPARNMGASLESYMLNIPVGLLLTEGDTIDVQAAEQTGTSNVSLYSMLTGRIFSI